MSPICVHFSRVRLKVIFWTHLKPSLSLINRNLPYLFLVSMTSSVLFLLGSHMDLFSTPRSMSLLALGACCWLLQSSFLVFWSLSLWSGTNALEPAVYSTYVDGKNSREHSSETTWLRARLDQARRPSQPCGSPVSHLYGRLRSGSHSLEDSLPTHLPLPLSHACLHRL